jgi:peptidoglycan-N-acetylglucosamine deacetylase
MQVTIHQHGRRDSNHVAITFDDGPNPPCTEEMIDIFNGAGARGNFFLIGKWVEAFPKTVERLLAGNHVIGNHGYSHEQGVGDFEAAELAIAHAIGRRSRFIRAPYFNQQAYDGMRPEFMRLVRVIHADVVAFDFRCKTAEEILDNVFAQGKVRGGSIICLHDGAELSNASVRVLRPLPVVDALPHIIARVREMGLEIVGLDEMQFEEA